MKEEKPVVRVGIGVFVVRDDGKFIIGERQGSHGKGTFALPGGHLEFGETFEECARREVLEETGLVIDVDKISFLTAVNSHMESENKHYVTVFMLGTVSDNQEPKVMEPTKCKSWNWTHWSNISQYEPLFQSLSDLLAQRPKFLLDDAMTIQDVICS